MAFVIYEDDYSAATYAHTLVLMKNGGETVPENPTSYNTSNAGSVTVYTAVPSTAPTWTGHEFLGYAYDPDGSVAVQFGASLGHGFSRSATYTGETSYFDAQGNQHIVRHYTSANQSASTYLYAKWALQTYSVSFDANGGTGAPSAQTKTYGVDLTLSSTAPTRANYNFLGWSTSSTGAVEYQAGDTFSVNADTVLYAIWAVAGGTLTSVADTAIEATGTAAWTKASNSHAYKLKLSFGNAPMVTVNVAANTTSCSFTIPSSWYAYIPNATSGTATAVLETYTDANYGTFVGSTSMTFTVSVASSVKPTISAFTATPHSENATVESWAVAVQGKSYATVAVTASAGAGASMLNVAISGPGINMTGTATSGNTTILTGIGTNTFTVTVTDSRGRTATATVNLTVYEYSTPAVQGLEAVRCLDNGTVSETDGGYLKAFPVFVFSPVNGHNSLSVKKIEYKEHSASTWTTGIASATSGTWSAVFGPADISKTFDVRCVVTDALGNSYTLEVIVPPVVGFAVGLNNDRARFGGPCEEEGLVDDWDFILKGDFIMDDGNGNRTTMTYSDFVSILSGGGGGGVTIQQDQTTGGLSIS